MFSDIYPALHRFASAAASRDTDPDDLVQESLVRVLRTGGLARVDSPSAYLRRVIGTLPPTSGRY